MGLDSVGCRCQSNLAHLEEDGTSPNGEWLLMETHAIVVNESIRWNQAQRLNQTQTHWPDTSLGTGTIEMTARCLQRQTHRRKICIGNTRWRVSEVSEVNAGADAPTAADVYVRIQ